ncbi:MAG TPA: large conductance mechanosensitive channel protein MscL [Leptolyngbyaceae cyanobacterium]
MASTGRRVGARAQGFWDDFKSFIMRGNLIDLALAVVLGAAFGAIVNSLVEDILMPSLINPLLAQTGTDWREIVVGPGIRLGHFLGTIVDFLIIAFVLYLVVKAYERLKRKEAVEAAEPTTEEKLNTTLERLTNFLESRL